MKDIARYGFILSLICIISGGLLSGINALTRPKIIAQAQMQEEAGLREIFPEGMRFEAQESEGKVIYYKVYNKMDKFIAVAFMSSGRGYSGDIEAMVGMDRGGKILAIKIIQQNETPGLGNRIIEPDFTGRFSHKVISQLPEITAITGATISSKAIIDSVGKKAQEIKELLENVPKNE